MALADLNVSLGLITKNFEQSLKGVQRSLARFERDVSKIGDSLTKSVTLPLAGLGTAAVGSFAQIEKSSKALQTALGGNADAARVELEKLRVAAQNPGLGFQQAIDGSVRLQAVGFTADEARNSLLQFGNAIALAGGSAADLDGVSLALTQIASKGKVSAEEIGQLAERVPQIRAIMLDAFGTDSGEAIAKLGVNAKDFVNIVTTEFAKLPRAENTLSNTFENLRQSITLSLASLGEEIAKAFDLQNVFENLGQKIAGLTDWFRALDDETKRNIVRIAAIAAAVGPAVLIFGKLVGVIGAAVSGFKLAFGVFKGVLTTLIGINPVVLAVGAAIAGLAVAGIYVAKNFEAFKVRFQNVWATIKNTFITTQTAILKGLEGFLEKITGRTFDLVDETKTELAKLADPPDFKSLRETFSELGNDILKFTGLAPKIGNVKQQIDGLADVETPSAPTATFTPSGGGIAKPVREAIEPLQQVETILAGAVERTREVAANLGNVRGQVQSIAESEGFLKFKEDLLTIGNTVQNVVVAGFDDFFSTLISKGRLSFKGFQDALKSLVAQLVKAVAVAAALSAIFTVFTGGAGAAKGLLGISGGKSLFGGIFRNVFGFAQGGIVPPGYPNDSYPALLTSGEVVSPPEKLSSLASGNVNVNIGGDFYLRGEDLIMAVRKAEAKYNRFS